ncbi:MAG: sugar phosphate isomerase/epimerase family protein [Bryobacteraceae bacterium]
MSALSRREFFQGAASAALVAAGAPGLKANPLGLPIGCQTWTVQKMIARDFPGTLKMLADAGFQAIELCSPVGYAPYGFGGLGKYKGAELGKIIEDHGLKCVSSHFSMKELRDDLAGRIAWAREVGMTQILVASLGGPRKPTVDDVKRAADEYNKFGEQSARAGITQGLHDENFEVAMIDGKRIYDMLFDLLDPKLVKFQFQVSEIQHGLDAAEYFTRYPGRFISMHVQGWSVKDKKIAAVGQDSLDWKKIFSAAKIGGIKNYFVEMELPLMKASVPYLRSLEV